MAYPLKQIGPLLLTPHGEREPGSTMRRFGIEPLLTPHGERELARVGRLRCGGTSPNPSWGTGTPGSTMRRFNVDPLLTPHGERERYPLDFAAHDALNS